MITPLLAAALLLLAGAALSAASYRSPNTAGGIGVAATWLAALVGLPPTLSSLVYGKSEAYLLPWKALPDFAWSFGVDALSAAFLCIVFLTPAIVSLALASYLAAGKASGYEGRVWAGFLTLSAAMIGVVLARNAATFLTAWEVMSIAAYFTIVPHAERKDVDRAGWLFFSSAHIVTAFLAPAMLILSAQFGTMEWSKWVGPAAAGASGWATHAVFILAALGFGMKAGVAPLHFWLPDSYTGAAGPVPGVVSGVMSKMGIYGLLRLTSLQPDFPQWLPTVMIVVGLLSAAWGIAMAVVQTDLKRLLAYSSVEHAGILFVGIGTAQLCHFQTDPNFHSLESLAWAAVIFHVWNHSICKSLLFVGCGSLEQALGHTNIDRLGGVLKQLPIVSSAFVLGAAAICGLPPFNLFASEFVIYTINLSLGVSKSWTESLLPWSIVGGLALTGGLAAYAFAKGAGLTLLGAERAPRPVPTLPLSAQLPAAVLAGLAVLGGLTAPWLLESLTQAVTVVVNHPPETTELALQATGRVQQSMVGVSGVCAFFWLILGGLATLRSALLRGREVSAAGTWGCGYMAPHNRLQYSGNSFSNSMVDLLGPLLGTSRKAPVFKEYFPQEVEPVETAGKDRVVSDLCTPLLNVVLYLSTLGKKMQTGRVHTYVAYIALTLIFLLFLHSSVLNTRLK